VNEAWGSPEHKRKDQAIEVDHQPAMAHQLHRLDQLGQFPTRIKHARLHGRLADASDFGNLLDRLAVVVGEVDDLEVLRR
jgi:hypothetical protein